jgi:ferredoxin
MGNSWLASPVRRVVQSICLLTFLFSFFYVCWPYRARPLPPGGVSDGWSCVGVNQQSGGFLMHKSDPDPWLSHASIIFLRQDDNGEAIPMEVAHVDAQTLELAPPPDLSDRLFDALLTEERAWTLQERPSDRWPSHYADDFASRERIPADLFLAIDPLVSLSTAIASRSWVWSLTSAAIILLVCLLVPRGFCGYLCPLGTTIDLFDWAIGSRTERFRVSSDGWWVHIKYYLLAATLIAASMGILISGFVSAIPVITRALLFAGEPIQSGMMRGWHLVPAPNLGQWISIGLFILVLMLGFLRPRFWCKYVCPSGAIFSLGNLLRITERKVESSCIHCNKCVEICPFDAIKPDFTTRVTDCTMCQSCGGVCPTHAIKFVERWNVVELKLANDPPTGETAIGRRGFLSLAGGSVAAVAGGVVTPTTVRALGANPVNDGTYLPVRPPGSVPEAQFLEMCIRCGQCFKVCPNNVLQPEGFEQGLDGLWTPRVEANWAGCESSCNACGQVCPTGAIRALTLDQKRVVRMGLAIVNENTCLPMAGREDCDLCVQECIAAGYRAIEYVLVGTEMDETGLPIDGSGRLAPVVLADKCVGCGLCQTRCYAINVKDRGVLSLSAIIVEAGPGKEDR